MAKVRRGDARSPDQRIVDGIREFYLGYLSKYLPMEAFDRVRADAVTETAMLCLGDIRREAATSGVPASPDASAWWALVMGAAASIEDAANCLRDPDAKKQADGAAKHYREAAQKLMAAAGVQPSDGGQEK